ncbi:hypothetical protein U1Q18_026367 [Sarracenia purpurea var. burkii]
MANLISPSLQSRQQENCNNMTSQLTTKLRLVKCPRCRGLLPELANVPVYTCGGCGTVLQAKKRNHDAKNTELHTHETDSVHKNELEHVSENKETPGLSCKETFSNTGEPPLENNSRSDQNETTDRNRKKSGDINFSRELSAEITCHGNGEPSPAVAAKGETEDDRDECSLKQNDLVDQNENRYCNEKQNGGVRFSNEITSSTELNHESEESSGSSLVGGVNSEGGEISHCLEQDNGRNRINEYGYCNGRKHGDMNFSDEVASSTELNHVEIESSPVVGAQSEVHEKRNCLEQDNGMKQNEYEYCNGKKEPGRVNLFDEVASSTELNHLGGEELSPVAGTESEVHENRNCFENSNGIHQSEFGDCKRKWPGNIKFSNEVSSSSELTSEEIKALSPVVETSKKFDENFESLESLVPDDLIPPRDEQLEQSHEKANDGFDLVSSASTLENIALANSISEFSVTLEDIPRFPTTRSNYAYDGSVSSYDGNDNHVPDQSRQLSRRKFKKAEPAIAKAIPRRVEDVMNKISSYQEMQHQRWNSSSVPSEKKHYLMKGSKWHQDESPEPTGHHGHPVKSKMKLESGECPSRVPFYLRGSQVGYEKGSTSNYGQNEFQYGTSFHPPKNPGNPEEEKMELLKMVYELQDQINRTHTCKGNTRFPGVAGTEKRIPSYYDHVAPEVEICHDLSCTRLPRRCNQGKSQPHHSRISRIPISAESGIRRHQVDHSCLHCYPQDRQRSALLPPHIYCNNKSQYIAHSHQRYYNLHCSNPSSPQHYPGSEFSIENCNEVKYPRERHQLKRHVRPVSGGAPFITCYHCSKLLQMPADFLLFKRRCHKLKCSDCSVILKFSLQNGNRIVPYTDYTRDDVAPPPSEAEDYIGENNERNLESVSYALKCPHAEPVSCSDDYGPSLCKSCSTEDAVKRDFNDRKISSVSSFEPMGEKKTQPIFKASPNMHKNPVDTFASAQPTFNISKAEKSPPPSKIEQLRPISGSPLHRLLGYTNPSQVTGN